MSTAFLLYASYRRRQKAPELSTQNSPTVLESRELRPLFQPTDDELRASERERLALEEAKAAESERLMLMEKADNVAEMIREWSLAPDRRGMIELILRASESGSAEIFAAASLKVIEIFREERIKNLTANDLADLLDSHVRTLPQQERSAGAAFRIREEIATLRARTEAAA